MLWMLIPKPWENTVTCSVLRWASITLGATVLGFKDPDATLHSSSAVLLLQLVVPVNDAHLS